MAKKSETKSAKDKPADANKAGWDAAAKASAAKDKQTKIKIDMRDVFRKYVEHEVPRPMGEAGFRQAAAQAAREHNRIKAIESEIHDFANGARCTPQGEPLPSRKAEIKALRESSEKLDREIADEAHLILTPCIELHDPNTNTVTIYTDDHGEPGEEIKARKMTAEEKKRASESAPFAPPTGETIEVEPFPPGASDDDATGGDA